MRFFRKQREIQQSNAAVDEITLGTPMAELPAVVSLNVLSPLRSSQSTSVVAADSNVIDASATTTPRRGEKPLTRQKNFAARAKSGFVIAFEKVSLEVGPSLFRRPRSLLRDVSGYLPSGSVSVVLCPNAKCSRKLLEVLVGVEERASGSVMANGLPVVSTVFRRRAAFITSTEVCLRDATVRSNLLFSVRMRVETLEEDSIVKGVAQAVRLEHLLEVKAEKLSPMQLYQLTLGMELVRNPMLLALHMPTRNLSTGEMHSFVSVLRGLAGSSGRVIVVSATELCRALFEIVDNILLLSSQGHLLYSGPKAGVEEFLREQGQSYIQRMGDESLGELLVTLDEGGDAAHVAGAFTASSACRRIQRHVEEHRKNIASNSFDPVSRAATPTPNYFLKWYLLTVHTCCRATIGQRSVLLLWTMFFFLFFLLAFLMAGSSSDQNAMQNKRGVVFFLVSCSMQVNTILVDVEVREFYSAVHLRNNNYFDTLQYFTATVVRLVLTRAVFVIIAASCTAFILESSLSLALTMGLTSLAHASLTLLLVYWHPVEQDVWLIENIYYVYCIILSGFLICLPSVPEFFSALSLLRYGYGGVVASELRGNPYSCDTEGRHSYCYTGDQYLAMEGFSHDSWGKSSLILFIITLVVLALVAVSMNTVWNPRRCWSR
ncbi:putative ABC transporter [Trypanosoma rangeli]|uniref:Putative ABC transporter n=1 Tax=Trypanosoma rangeli TaxID=5698 RepID=A0A3R7MIF6_TRYRA|nr:putative ABC transporter [Trypanosoma rangeli]RNF03093.1 putative ABC transporter [Trypanosoma rangeli]|eukprot:RNF03093.1 putative ABC transporter [Trypanosoma rangeli]